MKIYNYRFDTKEYIGFSQADKDPEESLIKGEFVPLVPAYATLIKPPICLKDEIQVFNEIDKKWSIIKKDIKQNME